MYQMVNTNKEIHGNFAIEYKHMIETYNDNDNDNEFLFRRMNRKKNSYT